MAGIQRRLILASRSARRRQLLEAEGFEFDAIPAPVDDSELAPGEVCPRDWVGALAYMKAESLARITDFDHAVVLGSDTVVVKGDEIIGQPRDKADAKRIVERLEDGSHEVMTGVAMIVDGERRIFVDQARVTVGTIGTDRIDGYLWTDSWRGKAGAYNLSERIADGWPIEYEGDPTCVMGLPMLRLAPMLHTLLDPRNA